MPRLVISVNIHPHEERRTTQAIVEVLDEAGVGFVVGMPGGNVGALFSRLHGHERIRTLLAREESLATIMAEAYGRCTGKPLVVLAQGEWIVGNAGQGLLEALLGSSPVVVLTDMSDGAPLSHHGHYQSGTGHYGAWNVQKALESTCKRVMICHNPVEAVHQTQLAFKHAMTGAPGPVAVVFHSSALAGNVGAPDGPRVYPTGPYLPVPFAAHEPTRIDEVAQALRAASRPVVVAGNGIRLSRAGADLLSLAASADVPIVTSQGGKGVVPERHDLVGGVIGTFGWQSANALLSEADFVLAVGTRLTPQDSADETPDLIDPARQTLVQIDAEPLNASWTFPMDQVLVGDAALVLRSLCEAVESRGAVSRSASARDRVVAAKALRERSHLVDSDDVPFHPHRIIDLLQSAVAEDTVVTLDAGENRLFMLQWYETPSCGDVLQPAGGGGMGYAVPAALGAKLADPNRPVVAVCGDGGFGMSVHGLMTAIEEGLPIGIVVLNNQALGWAIHGLGKRAAASELAAFDHAALARSLGADGVRPGSSEELRAAFLRLRDLSRPLVIDVPMSLQTSFKDVTASVASQYLETGYSRAAAPASS